MACETFCCVLTRGEFFMADWKRTCEEGVEDALCELPKAYKKLGNVSSCAIQIQATVLGKENEFNPIDETCARTMVEGVNITLTLNCASKENLYQALYSQPHVGEAGTYSEVYCIAELNECDFFPFTKHQADQESLVVVLKDDMGDIVYTLIEDEDYIFNGSGIEIIRSDMDLLGGVNLQLTYDYDSTRNYVIDFLSKYQGYKTLYFKGTNYDDGAEAMFDAQFYKVLFAPMNDFDLITGDEFFTITLSGSVEKDNGSWYKLTKKE